MFTCDVSRYYFDFAILELEKWIDVVAHSDELRHDLASMKKVLDLMEKARASIHRIEGGAVIFAQFSDKISKGVRALTLATLQSQWARG